MKKRIRLIVIIILTIVACLLIWRLWPNHISDLLPLEDNVVTDFSGQAVVRHYESEYYYNDTYYYIDPSDVESSNVDEIIEILNTSNYQQDYRNLLPGNIDTVHPDKNHVGIDVDLRFYYGDKPEQRVSISFLSNSLMVVLVGEETGFRIYHPTNPRTMDELVEYLKIHGMIRT